MSDPVNHTASYLLDLVHPSSEERFALYRCDTCFALVVSEDAADHGQWHAEQDAATRDAYGQGRDDEAANAPMRRRSV